MSAEPATGAEIHAGALGMGLPAFLWTFRAGQYEDPKGSAARIPDDHLDEGPPNRTGAVRR